MKSIFIKPSKLFYSLIKAEENHTTVLLFNSALTLKKDCHTTISLNFFCSFKFRSNRIIGLCSQNSANMVFCFKICPDLFWEKIIPVIQKNLRLKAREFAIFLGTLELFIWIVKGLNNCWNNILFNFILEASKI